MSTETIEQDTSPKQTGIAVHVAAIWIWFGLILLRCLFYFEINQTLGAFLWWIVDAGLFLGGVVLVGVSAVAVARGRARKRTVGSTICLLLIAAIFWATPYGYLLGASFRLLRLESEYEQEIADIQAAGALDDPFVEPGPPIRVAFSWGGMLDNWVGIVHDPSHTAGDLDESQFWFGGIMRRAQPLWGDWYICWFT